MNGVARIGAALIAGAFATYVMDVLGEAMYARQSDASKKREADVEPKSALSVLAKRILRRDGAEPTDDAIKTLGNQIHWAFGTGNGLAYALVDRVPMMSKLLGVPFALGLFAFDELGLPLFHLAPPPQAFPGETHERSLLDHLAYGAVLAVTYRGLTHLGSSKG